MRTLLAVAAILSGILLVVSAPPTDKAPWVHALGAFCFVLAFACLTRGRAALFFGSVVGSVMFLAGCWYLISRMGEVQPSTSGDPGQSSMTNALLFMVFYGLPGAGYAWWAGFGLRRRGSNSDVPDSADRVQHRDW